MSAPEYVKQITTAIQLENKEYYADRTFHDEHGWLMQKYRCIQKQCECPEAKMRCALRQSGDPTFVQPLMRRYLKPDSSTNNGADGSSADAAHNRTDWPPLRAPVSSDYGRLWRFPLETGGPEIRRVPYSTQRRIGSWNERFDRAS